MPLPYQVDTLDGVPEAARELYEETDEGGFRLPVEGVEPASEVAGLRSTLDKLKRERQELREKVARFSDDDVEELAALRAKARKKEEEVAAEEGKLDDLREKWQKETESKLGEKDQVIAAKDETIRRLAITSQLKAAIADADVLQEYRADALRALLDEFETDVKDVGGEPTGVFVDEVHGDKPIGEFVAEWAKSKSAQKYMAAPKGGGGAAGQTGNPNPSGKKYSEMTTEEKEVYLRANYGAGQAVA